MEKKKKKKIVYSYIIISLFILMEKIDKNLNKIILDTKVQMVMKNGLIRKSNVVIFLGNTGSGKSTLTLILAGKKVQIKVHKRIVELVCEGIKSGNKSFTDLPEIINDELNGITFVDTPGQKDTKGYVQQIKNAYSIHDLFNSNNIEKKVKILLVIKAEEIGVIRSESVQNLFNRLDEMFPNLTESEKKAFGIVFSCEIRNKDALYYIDKLNNEADESTVKWCNYFENHLEQVFIFPEASGEDGQSLVFDGKGHLIDFCKKDQLINPKPELSFDEEAKLYLKGGFSNHIYDLLQEAGKIFQKIDDIYQTLTDINELNKWSQNLLNFSKIQIKSPSILKNAIENNIVDGKSNFKREFERLDDLNALHTFYIDALKTNDLEIIEKIKNPMDKKISKLISKFNTHKKLVIEKQEAERKRLEAEHKKQEAERKRQDEERKRLEAEHKKEEAERKRQDEERKRLEAEHKREEAERKRQDAEKKMQEEKQKRIEKEKEVEENRKRLQFSQENNIKIKQLNDRVKGLLVKDEIISLYSDEKKGICNSLTKDQILITSNSVRQESNPENVFFFDDKNYYSEDKADSYICFNFLRRKVKIDYFNIFYAQYNKNCLIHFRIEGSNDTTNWITLLTVNSNDERNNPEANGDLYTIKHPYYPKEDEYKLYYKYIRIIQTGYSYNSYSYVMGIKNIEFYGNISEPIDI